MSHLGQSDVRQSVPVGEQRQWLLKPGKAMPPPPTVISSVIAPDCGPPGLLGCILVLPDSGVSVSRQDSGVS
jgi:hypothetical protein